MEGSIALIRALDRAFGTSTRVEALETTAAEQRSVLDAEMARSAELRAEVLESEQLYDSKYGDGPGSRLLGELPTASEVISNIEDMYRQGEQNPSE